MAVRRWFLNAYINQIKLIEQGKRPDSSYQGSFFDSWEEARLALINREELGVVAAKKELERAIASLDRAKKMKPGSQA